MAGRTFIKALFYQSPAHVKEEDQREPGWPRFTFKKRL